MTRALLVAGLVAACARTPLETSSDGALDAAAADSGPPQCNPLPTPPAALCTPEIQKQCQVWAQSLTTTGYAHSTCYLGVWSRCLLGYQNCNVYNGVPQCGCGGLGSCPGSQVCVSDTPDGIATCREVCVPYCRMDDKTKCSQPGEACWCTSGRCPSDQVCTWGANNAEPWSCQPQCLGSK